MATAAKDVKPGDLRSRFLDQVKKRKPPVKKPAVPRAASDAKPGDLRGKFLEKAKSGGIKAKASPGRSLVRSPGRAVVKGPGRAVVKFEPKGTSVTRYSPKGGAVVKAGEGIVEKGAKGVLRTAGRGLVGTAMRNPYVLAGAQLVGNSTEANKGERSWGDMNEARIKARKGPVRKDESQIYDGKDLSYKFITDREYPKSNAAAKSDRQQSAPGKGDIRMAPSAILAPNSANATEKGNLTYMPQTSAPNKGDKVIGDKGVGKTTNKYTPPSKSFNGQFKSDAAKKFAAKGQGKSAAPKSVSTSAKTSAKKPMTNFEMMKARGYEKEGYAGRAMTRPGAKAQSMSERKYRTFGSK